MKKEAERLLLVASVDPVQRNVCDHICRISGHLDRVCRREYVRIVVFALAIEDLPEIKTLRS